MVIIVRPRPFGGSSTCWPYESKPGKVSLEKRRSDRGMRRMSVYWTRIACINTTALIFAGSLGCQNNPVRGTEDQEIPDAVIATFRTEGEVFNVRVTRQSTIVDLYLLRSGNGSKEIIRGPLRTGSGEGAHNEPWSWHLSESETILTDLPDEGCDGTPSQVEENLAEWLAGGFFCPSAAELIALQTSPHS
jgi:hypothetical protein